MSADEAWSCLFIHQKMLLEEATTFSIAIYIRIHELAYSFEIVEQSSKKSLERLWAMCLRYKAPFSVYALK